MESEKDSAPAKESAKPILTTEEARIPQNHGAEATGQQSAADQAFVDRIDRSDRWMIFLTGAIALTGIVSALIFGWQLNVMQGQLDEMKQSFASDRAYVLNGGFSGVGNREIVTGDSVTIAFENFGKTPAEIRTIGAQCRFSRGEPPVISTNHSEMPPGYILESGRSIPRITVMIEASAEELTAAKASYGHVFCEAAAGYDDVRGARHETVFTFVYDFGNQAWALYNDDKWNRHT